VAIWKAWDDYCWDDDGDIKKKVKGVDRNACYAGEDEYAEYEKENGLTHSLEAKSLVLSKRAEKSAHQDSGFDSGLVYGATIGTVGAIAAAFAIKRCTSKAGVSSDDF